MTRRKVSAFLFLLQDCPARLIKRKRACVNYAAQAGSPDQQQSVGQGASAAAPAPVAASVPWAASFLLDYVRQCLNNLTSMHATCIAIQRDTRAAELACAIFRQVAGGMLQSPSAVH